MSATWISNEHSNSDRDDTEDLRRFIVDDEDGLYTRADDRELEAPDSDMEDNTFALEIPADAMSEETRTRNSLRHHDDGTQPESNDRPQRPLPEESQSESDESESDDGPQEHTEPRPKQPQASIKPVAKQNRARKVSKVSRHGISYQSLPKTTIRKLAAGFIRSSAGSKAKITKDTLDAITQSSDWYFEQLSEDLGTYATHAGRKTIDETDVTMLMKRYDRGPTAPFAHL